MSNAPALKRTAVNLLCGLLIGVLPVQFARAASLESQNASRAAAARSAIEEIEGIARADSDKPEALKLIHNKSQAVVRKLAQSGSAALPGIETALSDSKMDARVKAMLCSALGRIKDEKADELLGRVLDDPSQPKMILAYAADGIGRKRTPTAIAVIKRAVMDTRLPIDVRSAIMVDAGTGGIDDVDWLARIAQGKGIGLPEDQKAEISQNEFTMILIAQRALARLKDPAAVDVMISLVERYPSNGILVEGLGKSGDRRAIPVLIRVLTDESIRGLARNDAARALAELKAREAVDSLIEAVENRPNEALVAAAATALGKIGDKRALPALEKLVANLKNDPRFPEVYWRQAADNNGYIPPILNALEELR